MSDDDDVDPARFERLMAELRLWEKAGNELIAVRELKELFAVPTVAERLKPALRGVPAHRAAAVREGLGAVLVLGKTPNARALRLLMRLDDAELLTSAARHKAALDAFEGRRYTNWAAFLRARRLDQVLATIADLLLTEPPKPPEQDIPPARRKELEEHVDRERARHVLYGGDRIYRRFELRWTFSLSSDGSAWDGRCDGIRSMLPLADDGLELLLIDLPRRVKREFVPGGVRGVPSLRVISTERDLKGAAEVVPWLVDDRGEPPSQFQIEFSPRLAPGEVGTVRTDLVVPHMRYRYREDLFRGRAGDRSLPRLPWEFYTREVSYPFERLIVSLFFPDELGAVIGGVMATRSRTARDFYEEQRLADEQCISDEPVVQDGVKGRLLQLEVANPPLKMAYRFYWQLPQRPDAEPVI